MKNNYFMTTVLLCHFMIFGKSIAQPTITSASSPQLNASYTVFDYDAQAITAGASGANVTWDFSSILATSNAQWRYQPSSAGPASPRFPAANIFQGMSGEGDTYFILDNQQYSITGFAVNDGSLESYLHYDDPRALVRYPITYQDVFNEDFSGTETNVTLSQTLDRTGSSTIRADGYGTLIMPYGTIENVLRVQITSQVTDELMGFPVADYFETLYMWFHPDVDHQILLHAELTSNVSPDETIGHYLDAALVGIENVVEPVSFMTVYPNPAEDHINISYAVTGNRNVRIRLNNLLGQEVDRLYEGSLNQGTYNQVFDVSKVQSGVYYLEMFSESHVVTKKVMISH